MGKITRITKSRKDHKCNKCHTSITIGSPYIKGDLNFSKPIVRCLACGLQPWEVTTSEYQLSVGDIVYNWQKGYDLDDNTPSDIAGSLEEIKDECEGKLDNMPEGLRESPTGELLQERIDNLEGAISELEGIDVDNIKESAMEEVYTTDELNAEGAQSYDELMENEAIAPEIKASIKAVFNENLTEVIEEALNVIDV